MSLHHFAAWTLQSMVADLIIGAVSNADEDYTYESLGVVSAFRRFEEEPTAAHYDLLLTAWVAFSCRTIPLTHLH